MNFALYVVDTSVYVPLLMLLRSRLRRVMVEYGFHLLDLTLYESCNVFWKECVKLHRIDMETARRSCRLAVALARYATLHRLAELDPGEIIDIAVKDNITVYDASYIALAIRLGAPLASNDQDLLRTAPKYGVKAYSLGEFLEMIREQGSLGG